MSETSTTIREQVVRVILKALSRQVTVPDDETLAAVRKAADEAVAIVVEVYRNGQASLIEEERKDE